MDATLFLPNNAMITMLLVSVPTLFAYLSAKLFLNSRTFRPGSQYMSTVVKLKGSSSKNSEKAEKDINKQQKARVVEDNFNLMAKRCGLNITQEENSRRRMLLLVPALLSFMVIEAMAIVAININMILTLIMMVVGLIVPMLIVFNTEIKLMKLQKQLKSDMIKDISRLVSLYKYADTKRGIYGTIMDFINDSTALRTDLEMFVADLNSFEINEALDRMGERVPVTQMGNFISYVKSSAYMSNEQVVYSVMSLDNELRTQVKDIMDKEVKAKFKRSMIVVLLCFAAVLLIYIAPQLADAGIEEMLGGGVGIF